jgi:hypothetical protein
VRILKMGRGKWDLSLQMGREKWGTLFSSCNVWSHLSEGPDPLPLDPRTAT